MTDRASAEGLRALNDAVLEFLAAWDLGPPLPRNNLQLAVAHLRGHVLTDQYLAALRSSESDSGPIRYSDCPPGCRGHDPARTVIGDAVSSESDSGIDVERTETTSDNPWLATSDIDEDDRR